MSLKGSSCLFYVWPRAPGETRVLLLSGGLLLVSLAQLLFPRSFLLPPFGPPSLSPNISRGIFSAYLGAQQVESEQMFLKQQRFSDGE